jgi:hypothetical protein
MERIGYRFPPACGFTPAAGFTDLHRVGKAIPTILYPFLVSRRVGRIATANSTASGAAHKRKTPNGFGGLDPWRWAILESVRFTQWEKFTHSKTTQAHQKHRGLLSIVYAVPTVATPLASPILHEPGARSTPTLNAPWNHPSSHRLPTLEGTLRPGLNPG